MVTSLLSAQLIIEACITASLWFFACTFRSNWIHAENFFAHFQSCVKSRQTKHNGHFTFKYIINYWGAGLEIGMPGTICFPCNVVATHGLSISSVIA